MAITRRQFITRTGLATAGAFFGPSLFRNPLLRRAMAETIGDRYLIVLFLDGGNDGLNTIIPVSGGSVGMRGDYETWRHSPATSGGLRIVNPLVPSQPMIDMNTGTQIGFHPGLSGLRDMYDQNRVAVIQGCGYPEYNLSHDVSRSIWRRGAPLSTPSTGWLGRYLAAAGYMGADIPAVTIGGAVAGELSQTATSVLVFDRLRDFGFPYDFDFDGDDDPNPDDTPFKNNVFNALCTAATSNGHPLMQYLGGTGTATLLAAASYPELHNAYVNRPGSFNDLYQNDEPPGLNTSTARNLREIAKVIYGVASDAPNVNARFFEFANGGYDTHSDQGTDNPDDAHYSLHKEIGDAIKLFYDELADMASGASAGSKLENLDSKVCVIVWSEFSRRIEQNDNGTDHGSQGPVLVIGGGVTGGLFGDHPNIAESALDDDGNTVYKQDTSNGARSTDFRDVYGTIIKHWLNVTDQPTLDGLLPLDSTLGFSGPDYWTAADFDMGFLP
jgi:uncharacterized protein (DUF1501 family)